MRNCPSCQSELPENARFCPQCGEKVFEETLTCPDCGAENAINAKFCFHCGMEFFINQPPPMNDIFRENPVENIEQLLVDDFKEAFKERIEAEHNPTNYDKYVKRFNHSDFKTGFEFRMKQLAEQVQQLREQGSSQDEQPFIQKAYEDLLDYFIIHYCQDLNEIVLPETILKYQNIKEEDIDLGQMIMDYLDFGNEEETVYTDFVAMPFQKLKNATDSFLFPHKEEKILFICDQTVLGSLKEGFALTEAAIYWKAHFEPAQSFTFPEIAEVKRQEDWLTINGHFFNVNKSVNLKLMKLLKKLKRIEVK